MTQKQIIEYHKVRRFEVLSFEHGRRSSSYSNIDVITALAEVAKHLKAGKKVLILDYKSSVINLVGDYEAKHKHRIPYHVVFPHTLSYSGVTKS